MSPKFNRTTARPRVDSAVTSTGQTTTTYEGGTGYLRDQRSELVLLAVTNMVGESTFYESAGDRDSRFSELCKISAVEDGPWFLGFIGWLRGSANMRSASLVGAADGVKARLDYARELEDQAARHPGPVAVLFDESAGLNRKMINAVLQRPDEPGEFLAYWTGRYGKALPMPVKRGVGDAVRRLYTQKSLLKYDTESHGWRFADVLDLTHPAPDPDKPWQGDLFTYALHRRPRRNGPHPDQIPESLTVVQGNKDLRKRTDPNDWLSPENLRNAGMTWEDALSAVGSKVDKARLWSALIPSMGYMALIRNLRNFDEAGVSDEVAAQVSNRISDPGEVARSRQFPFRFLSAYRAAPSLRWGHALETALGHSLVNVPSLSGRTLVLVDRSGSMFYSRMSERSDLNRADAAAIFGSALAVRAANADLVQFGTRSQRVPFVKSSPVLRLVDRFGDLGGTNTTQAVKDHYNGHTRVIIVTDEQASYRFYGNPTEQVPKDVPVYTWNLAGYRAGHGPSGTGNRHTFGGLSDAGFKMVPLLEAAKNAAWPWLES